MTTLALQLATSVAACVEALEGLYHDPDINTETVDQCQPCQAVRDARTALAAWEAREAVPAPDNITAWTMVHGWSDEFNGTSLKGEMDCSYADIVRVFGKETSKGDDYKVQAEWLIRFADGTVATIYDYKMGKKYNGRDGIAKTKVRDWHIGGHNSRARELVLAAMFPTTQPGEKA